jgi:hypothetical protein
MAMAMKEITIVMMVPCNHDHKGKVSNMDGAI